AFLVRLVGFPPKASAIVASSARSLRSRPSTSIESRLTVVMSLVVGAAAWIAAALGWVGTRRTGFGPGATGVPGTGEVGGTPPSGGRDWAVVRQRPNVDGSGSAGPQPPPVRHGHTTRRMWIGQPPGRSGSASADQPAEQLMTGHHRGVRHTRLGVGAAR